MCDRANSSTGCDIVDNLQLEIDNLEERLGQVQELLDEERGHD